MSPFCVARISWSREKLFKQLIIECFMLTQYLSKWDQRFIISNLCLLFGLFFNFDVTILNWLIQFLQHFSRLLIMILRTLKFNGINSMNSLRFSETLLSFLNAYSLTNSQEKRNNITFHLS